MGSGRYMVASGRWNGNEGATHVECVHTIFVLKPIITLLFTPLQINPLYSVFGALETSGE